MPCLPIRLLPSLLDALPHAQLVPVPRRFDRRPPERDTTRINERIRVPEVRLIGDDGEQIGVVDDRRGAARRARSATSTSSRSRPTRAAGLPRARLLEVQVRAGAEGRRPRASTSSRSTSARSSCGRRSPSTTTRPRRATSSASCSSRTRSRSRSCSAAASRPTPSAAGRCSTACRGRLGELGDDRAGAPAGGPQHDDGARSAREAGQETQAAASRRRRRADAHGRDRASAARCVQRARGSASIARPMPKMKTHSGAKKRFRKTATGKLRGRHAYSSHILEKKSPKRKRRIGAAGRDLAAPTARGSRSCSRRGGR